jgi:Pathogenicity locus
MSGHSRQGKSRGSKAAGSSSRRPGPDSRATLTGLEQLPNVGPAVAGYLRRLGVTCPQHLVGRDPYAMYDELCRVTGRRLDPCLLDTFIAAVRFMAGEPATPWWAYTAERKRELGRRRADQESG